MKTIRFSLLLVLALLLIYPLPVRADIAPPDWPSGANPLPGNAATRVRMLSEEVLIDVLGRAPQSSLGQARVTARFTMLNLGDQDERMPVRFPLTFFGQSPGDPVPSSELKDVKVKVNGRPTATRRVEYSWLDEPASPWAEFDVTFPPGVEVPVEVTYLQEGAGEYPFISLEYTLETGAGWDGTIGAADLVVRLPYEASPQNVIFDEQIGWSQTTPGGVFDGREVRWHYEDLEPGWEHNLQVSLVMPPAWRRVLDEQANVERNPADGEAWGRLGKLYKEISRLRRGYRSDPGGQALYRLSLDAYEQALELLPEDAAWHAGFADLLYGHYYYDQYFLDQPDHRELLRALEHLDRALALDPRQEKALAVIEDMSYAMPEAVIFEDDRYELLWLTATPTRLPSETPEPAISTPVLPGSTPAPGAKPSPEPVTQTAPARSPTLALPSPAQVTLTPPESPPQPGPAGGLCGGAALLPLGVAVGIGVRRRPARRNAN